MSLLQWRSNFVFFWVVLLPLESLQPRLSYSISLSSSRGSSPHFPHAPGCSHCFLCRLDHVQSYLPNLSPSSFGHLAIFFNQTNWVYSPLLHLTKGPFWSYSSYQGMLSQLAVLQRWQPCHRLEPYPSLYFMKIVYTTPHMTSYPSEITTAPDLKCSW